MHAYDDCDLDIDDLGLLSSVTSRNKDGAFQIDAHVIPINTASRFAATGAASSSARTEVHVAGEADQPGGGGEQEDGLAGADGNSQGSPSDNQVDKDDEKKDEEQQTTTKDDNKRNSEAEAEWVYVVLGTLRKHENKNRKKGDIEMEVLLVLKIDLDKDPIDSSFIEVNTWVVNGVRFGNCRKSRNYDHDLFTAKGKATGWKPDDYFADCKTKDAIRKKAIDLAMHERDVEFPSSLVRRPPIRPAVNRGDPKKLPMTTPKTKGDITAVLVIENEFDENIDLQLRNDRHAFVEDHDTGKTFREYLFEEVKFKNVKRLAAHLDGLLTQDWDVEVFVVPQLRGTSDMYIWTADPGMKAEEWLDENLSEQYGRQLYIEIQVVAKKEETALDTTRDLTEGLPTVTEAEAKQTQLQWRRRLK